MFNSYYLMNSTIKMRKSQTENERRQWKSRRIDDDV